METTTMEKIKPRRPIVAELLSLLAAGLGHIYCGRFGKGLLLFFAGVVLGIPGMLGLLPLGLGYRITGIVAIAAGAGIWIYSIWDARRIAKKIGKNYVLKDYNRWWIYLLLFMLPFPIIIGGSFLVRETMLEAFHATSKSMYPTINFGERFMASKMAYRSGPIQRGDVIVFLNPNKRYQNNFKRVVALPGDTVEIQNNELLINDKKLRQNKVGDSDVKNDKMLVGEIFQETNDTANYRILLASSTETTPTNDKKGGIQGRNFLKTTVPNGHCFVLGDNRNNSIDSRNYGPIPMSDIVGRVGYIYYPRWVNLRD
jgi:signal peptidase I